jgi:hypothetical protein
MRIPSCDCSSFYGMTMECYHLILLGNQGDTILPARNQEQTGWHALDQRSRAHTLCSRSSMARISENDQSLGYWRNNGP